MSPPTIQLLRNGVSGNNGLLEVKHSVALAYASEHLAAIVDNALVSYQPIRPKPMRKIELWDQHSNYIWGNLKDDSKIELWDKNSDYIWGKLKDDGKIELWDKNGGYIWGKLKDDSKIELWAQDGSYIWGKLRT